MNWSYLRSVIDDMSLGEDFCLVCVQLPDGRQVYPVDMKKDEHGQWLLIVESAQDFQGA